MRPVMRMLSLWLLLATAGCGLIGRQRPPVDTSQDARIRAEIETRFAREPAVSAEAIRVAVRGGVVTLFGTVRGIGAWHCALANADLVEGVFSVVDQLELRRGPREAQCLAAPLPVAFSVRPAPTRGRG